MKRERRSAPRRPRGSGSRIGVRAAAALAVDEALASRAPVDTLLPRLGARFDERDRRLLAELVYSALRWLLRLDHVLERAAERPLDSIDAELLAPLRVALVQLLALDRVPAHAAVAEAVDDARRRRGRGAAGFANAVLRRVARSPRWEEWPVAAPDPVTRLAIEGSHPRLLVERWWQRFGEAATRSIVEAGNGPRTLHLLAFADRGGRDALASSLSDEGIVTRPSRLSPLGLLVESGQPLRSSAFERGEFYVQDEASQAAALVPPPAAGERLLDAASAPGGKVFAALAREPGVRVVAADASIGRLGRFDTNLARLGRAVPRVAADAARPPWRDAFDRVMLDAPCSGTGTLRRHPELRWRFSLAELERLAGESEPMLRGLVSAVRPGGVVTLVTCSIEAEENEAVIDRVLADEPHLERFDLGGLELPPADAGDPRRGLWRVLPNDGHDGFTVHALRRGR